MEVFETMAINSAERISTFMVKYAEFLKNLALTKGANVDKFDEAISTLKGKFQEVLEQRLKCKYEPLYNDGLVYFRPEKARVELINGNTHNSHNSDLSFIKACLDECGIDKELIDLELLSGVCVAVEIDKVMPDTNLTITYTDKEHPSPMNLESETLFFEGNRARFSGDKEQLSVDDAMESAIRLATIYHKAYIDATCKSLERLQEVRNSSNELLHQVLNKINKCREEVRIVPTSFYEEEEIAEANLGYANYEIESLENYLRCHAANVEFEGGKYAYKYLEHSKDGGQPGEED